MNRWISIGLMVILSYPLVVGFLFVVSFMLHHYLYAEKAPVIFEKREQYLYLLFLSIFFFFILFVSIRSGIFQDIGITFELNIFTIILIITSISAGNLIYKYEYFFTTYTKPFFDKLFQKKNLSRGNVNKPAKKDFHRWIILSILISICEEFIWRGFLITALTDYLRISTLNSILISSILFAINHYYFGIQAVSIKIVSGFIFGGLYIITPSILFPIISHSVFNIIVGKKLSND